LATVLQSTARANACLVSAPRGPAYLVSATARTEPSGICGSRTGLSGICGPRTISKALSDIPQTTLELSSSLDIQSKSKSKSKSKSIPELSSSLDSTFADVPPTFPDIPWTFTRTLIPPAMDGRPSGPERHSWPASAMDGASALSELARPPLRQRPPWTAGFLAA